MACWQYPCESGSRLAQSDIPQPICSSSLTLWCCGCCQLRISYQWNLILSSKAHDCSFVFLQQWSCSMESCNLEVSICFLKCWTFSHSEEKSWNDVSLSFGSRRLQSSDVSNGSISHINNCILSWGSGNSRIGAIEDIGNKGFAWISMFAESRAEHKAG